MTPSFWAIEWGFPAGIYLLPLWIMLGIIIMRSYFVWRKKINVLVAREHYSLLLRNFSLTRIGIRTFLLFLTIGLLALVCFRPQWGIKEKKVLSEGRAVLIALDISRSMLAQDYKPNRLEFAKKKIKELIYLLNADRVGLIIFSDSALLQCPLTVDRAAFFMFLDAVDFLSVSPSSTALDQPLEKAIEVYNRLPEQKSKLLLLITDGEDFKGNTHTIAEDLKRKNIALWCLAVGTLEGAPIPVYDDKGNQQGHLKDRKGSIVITHLNEQLLQKIVQACGGHYCQATSDHTDLAGIYSWIESYEKQQNSEALALDYEDHFYYLTGLSFISLIIQWLL